jgi:predicted aspartyl protease
MLILGSFDGSGSPIITIRIVGTGSPKDYTATIDTGFTGFVALNIFEMIPLGLMTRAAATVTLGNGTSVEDLLADGSVTLGGRTEIGSILLSDKSTDILVGLDFLRKFNLALVMTATVVVLYDQNETLTAILAATVETPAATPNTAPTFISTGRAP